MARDTGTKVQITGQLANKGEPVQLSGVVVQAFALGESDDKLRPGGALGMSQTDSDGRFTLEPVQTPSELFAEERTPRICCVATDGSRVIGMVYAPLRRDEPRIDVTIDLDVANVAGQTAQARRPTGARSVSSLNGGVQTTHINIDDADISLPLPYRAGYPLADVGTSDPTAIIDSELARLLGRPLDPGAPSTADEFVESLNRMFRPVEEDGRIDYEWTGATTPTVPHHGAEVQLTGEQAVLHARAKDSFEAMVRLIESINPIKALTDAKDAEALRLILTTLLGELVEQLGNQVPPDVPRLDNLFALLTRELKQLEIEFGFQRKHVDLPSKQQEYTKYLRLADYINSLCQSWEQARGELTRPTLFFSSQLSDALVSVATSAEAAVAELEAAGVGKSERRSVIIRFVDGTVTSIDAVLDWAEHWSRTVAPALLQGAGGRGMRAMRPTAEKLQTILENVLSANVTHPGFARPRVHRALGELATNMGEVVHVVESVGLEGDNVLEQKVGDLERRLAELSREVAGLRRPTRSSANRPAMGQEQQGTESAS